MMSGIFTLTRGAEKYLYYKELLSATTQDQTRDVKKSDRDL
jgi:hypothetical protein